jgi:molecular chaperone GrpE
MTADIFTRPSRPKVQERKNMDTEIDMDRDRAKEREHEAQNMAAADPAVTQVDYEALKVDRDQLFDRLARLQAEFDNARKRDAKERSEFRDYTTGAVVEQFLPVLDNFQLALNSAGSAEQLRAGVELIVKQMEEVLRNFGVVPVETVGAQFDPRVHEALEAVETVDVPDQQVIDEVRRGYRIRERLLRPALVRIAHNSQQHQT